MKKIFSFFHQFFSGGTGKIILDVATSTAIDKGGDLIEQALNDFYAKKPKECSALVVSLYVWADTSLEDLTKKSKTDIDDKAVSQILRELENFAAAKGITLPNLDAD